MYQRQKYMNCSPNATKQVGYYIFYKKTRSGCDATTSCHFNNLLLSNLKLARTGCKQLSDQPLQ